MFIIELVHALFAPGVINLDPCSNAAANARVHAALYFTKEMDGLDRRNKWAGNIFLNPPYGLDGKGKSIQGLFVQRCIDEDESGNITQAVLLLKGSLGLPWLSPIEHPHCLLRERLAYVKGSAHLGGAALPEAGTTAPHGSILAFMGPPEQARRFAHLASAYAHVPGLTAWAYS
jgi:hypothetical protein